MMTFVLQRVSVLQKGGALAHLGCRVLCGSPAPPNELLLKRKWGEMIYTIESQMEFYHTAETGSEDR